MERRLFLDILIGQGTAFLRLLPSEDEPLLIRRNALLILNLGLHVIDGVGALHLQRDGLAGQSFHEDLHLFEREICEREICENLRFREIFG